MSSVVIGLGVGEIDMSRPGKLLATIRLSNPGQS